MGPTSTTCWGLADVLDPGRRLHVVTPRGPLPCPVGPGMTGTWFRASATPTRTFHAAFDKLAGFHDELWERTAVGRHSVLAPLLDGLSDELSLGLCREPPVPAGVLAFSGFVPTVDGWAPRAAGPEHARLHRPRAQRPIMDVAFARHRV